MNALNSASSPSKLDFAREVRADRLSLLWKITVAGAFAVFWAALILSSLAAPVFIDVALPTGLVVIGCIATRLFLRRSKYEWAVWAYTFGLLAAIGILLLVPQGKALPDAGREMVPFVLPIVILLVGLLLPARATFLVLGISVVMTVVIPSLGRTIELSRYQMFSIILMGIAAGIAAQISGELYGIAEWALESYEKERSIKEQLFDREQEIQRMYNRQKALADELKDSNRQLEVARAAAMEAKNFRGQFLANMSHELRTPLNAIIGFSETMLNFPMMYDNQLLPDPYKTDMTQIYNSGRHLLQIINDILDLSKVDAGRLEMEMERVEIDPVFSGVLSTAQGLIGEKPVQLKRETIGVIPDVKADSLRLRQVILNLMSNAAKFTDTGSITLGARDSGNGEVMIWVKDTGIGIPAQDIDKIFEEFRQGTSGRRKGRAGSGLGLAISRQLLNLMGGRIWVESSVGMGSSFYFTLPIYQPEPVNEKQG